MIQQWIEHLKNYLRDDISKVKEMKQWLPIWELDERENGESWKMTFK
jgi:molybdopterin synthase catalytic subunit